MFELRRFTESKPITEQDRAAAARVLRAWQTASDRTVLGRGRRLVNRLHDRRKDEYVARFQAAGELERYPCVDSDCRDENAFPCEPDAGADAPASRRRSNLCATLAAEIERAYRLTARSGPDAVVLAGSLLRSEHGTERLDVSETEPAALSVAFVLAHLEALGFGLAARLSGSIARRATIVLLDHARAGEPAA